MVNFELFELGAGAKGKKTQQQKIKTQNQQQTKKNTQNFFCVSSVSICANCLLSVHWTPLFFTALYQVFIHIDKTLPPCPNPSQH